MKIALFIPDLYGGGAQRMIVNMALTYAAQGHETHLVLGTRSGTYERLLVEPLPSNLRVIDFDKKRVTGTLFPLIKYLKTEKPDVLLSALTHANIMALAAKMLAPKVPTKIIVSERNHFSSRTGHNNGKREAINSFLMPLFYRTADAVVGISEGVARDVAVVAKLPANKIHWIHNPVVTPDLIKEAESDIEPDATTAAWLNRDTTPVIVTSGRLVKQKDHRTLFEAFALLQKQKPSRLLMLGEGSRKEYLEDLAKDLGITDKIHFAGFVDHPLAAMKRANLFVLSSRWEGFGNVVVEALLCDLPVVSTDCPAGPAEILDHGKYGLLVPMQNPEALCEAMAKALDTPINPGTQKQRAMDFTAEKICKKYEALFQKLLETRT